MRSELEQQLAELQPGDHICLIYDDATEQMAVAMAFIKEGLARGDRCVYIADEHSVGAIMSALGAAGVDVADARVRGALSLLTAQECRQPGAFEPASMLNAFHQAERSVRAAGFTGWRVAVEMTWALQAEVGPEWLLQYEALADRTFGTGSQALALCQYSRHRFQAAALRDILRTHPLIALKNRICPNPYYEEPDLILGERSEDARTDWMLSQIWRLGESERARTRLAVEQAARAEATAAQDRIATILASVARKQQLLIDVSTVLSSSLDYDATLQRVARLAVPAMADWCIIDVVDTAGQVRRVAVAAADPHKGAILDELRRRYPPGWHSQQPAARALRAGDAILLHEVDHDSLAATCDDAAHLELLRELAPRSAIAVPLVARSQTLGAMTFATSESGRQYSSDDLSLIGELARQCATAIDNARLYQEVRKAGRVRDEFLSVAAHELKTPITSLRGFAQVIVRRLNRDGAVDPERLRRALQAIDEQSTKLANLVTQLLDVSRIEAGKLILDRQIVNLADLVKEVVTRGQTMTDRHDIVVQAPAKIEVFIDPLRVEQVVANLLDNAIKYSPDGGPIDVEVSKPSAGAISMAVRDRGVGIPPEHRRHIFNRFYQAHASSHYGGMGLGLYISRQIVQLHGGELDVEYPADGGTRFVVTLPARPRR